MASFICVICISIVLFPCSSGVAWSRACFRVVSSIWPVAIPVLLSSWVGTDSTVPPCVGLGSAFGVSSSFSLGGLLLPLVLTVICNISLLNKPDTDTVNLCSPVLFRVIDMLALPFLKGTGRLYILPFRSLVIVTILSPSMFSPYRFLASVIFISKALPAFLDHLVLSLP